MNHQPLIRGMPVRCTASCMRRASSIVIARGFSQKTCLPASRAWIDSSAWVSCVEQIMHRVDPVVGQDPVQVGREVVGLGLLGAFPSRVLYHVHGRRQAHLRRREDVRQVVAGDAAAAYQPDP